MGDSVKCNGSKSTPSVWTGSTWMLRWLQWSKKIVPLSFSAIALAFAIASSAITDQEHSKLAACWRFMIFHSLPLNTMMAHAGENHNRTGIQAFTGD